MHPASVNRRPGRKTQNPPHPGPPWAGLVLVALAFGVVEAILVLDLRHFVDPDGTQFPLVNLPDALWTFERVREGATLVLLGAAAMLVRACAPARFATFLFLFGVWDVTYYATLRVLIGWPSTASAWDLLFLLPKPWLGPVYAPVAISCVMIAVGILTWRVEQRTGCFRVRPHHFMAAILGGAVCIATFVFDANARALVALPARYPIEWLLVGLAIAIAGYIDAWRLNRRRSS